MSQRQLHCSDRIRQPDVCYAGMMTYDGDTNLPPRILVEPPVIDRTMPLAEGVRAQALLEGRQVFGKIVLTI
jgi:hypothetical protein